MTSPFLLRDRPVVTAVGGALCIAFSAIFVRYADVTPSTAAFFRCAYALPALAVLATIEHRGRKRSRRERKMAFAAGVFFAADLIFWHHSIDAVGAGLATVLGNTQVVFVGLLAWVFLREKPPQRALLAIPIVLAGIVLISGVIEADAYGDDPRLGAFFGILTALCYSGFILVLRHGSPDARRPAGPLLDATFAAAVISGVAGLALGDLELSIGSAAHGWLIILALTSQVLGWLLITMTLPQLPAATTSVILTLQPVGSVLLGALLLTERPSPTQVAGILLVLGTLIVVSRGADGKVVPMGAAPAETEQPST